MKLGDLMLHEALLAVRSDVLCFFLHRSGSPRDDRPVSATFWTLAHHLRRTYISANWDDPCFLSEVERRNQEVEDRESWLADLLILSFSCSFTAQVVQGRATMDTVALFALLIDLCVKQDAIITALQKKGYLSLAEVSENLPSSLQKVQVHVDAAKKHYAQLVLSLKGSG